MSENNASTVSTKATIEKTDTSTMDTSCSSIYNMVHSTLHSINWKRICVWCHFRSMDNLASCPICDSNMTEYR